MRNRSCVTACAANRSALRAAYSRRSYTALPIVQEPPSAAMPINGSSRLRTQVGAACGVPATTSPATVSRLNDPMAETGTTLPARSFNATT